MKKEKNRRLFNYISLILTLYAHSPSECVSERKCDMNKIIALNLTVINDAVIRKCKYLCRKCRPKLVS